MSAATARRDRGVSVRVISVAAVVAALVGCGSGVRQGSTSGSLAALSSVPPPPPVPKSAAPATSPVPANSWPNPGASNFSISPAVSVPSVTLLDVEHRAALVGVVRTGSGTQGQQPSTLWLSTDLVHWADVTPPAVRQPLEGGLFATFDQASFLSPSTGWVTTWNGGNLGVTIYGTSDGGKSWTVLASGEHGDHAGDAEWIQLLTPTLAFDENIAATAPHMSLAVTTDAGASWRTVYTLPPQDGQTLPPNPFGLPMVFTSQLRGFAATGIPPAGGYGSAGFFQTADGGVSWTATTPPGSPSTTCPQADGGTVECLSALPSFSDATHAVLASEVVDGATATVGFDVTNDGGSSWRLTTTVDVPIPLVRAGSYPKTYALVATPSSRTWWIVSANGNGVTTRVSSDAGQHWSVVDSTDVLGAPFAIGACDATHALLETEITTSDGTTSAIYVTSDGGRSWETLFGT